MAQTEPQLTPEQITELLKRPSAAQQQRLRSYLAFDFGLKRMGVAKGQTLTKTAEALAPLAAKEGKPDWSQVEQLLTLWQVDALVIGLPLNMDGTASDMSLRAVKFSKRLHGRFGKPVFMCDERLSSHEAKGQVIAEKGQQHFGEYSVDGLAAKIILESFFHALR